ncbi:unnamed protein product, partial [Staurois parvus]
RCPLCPPDTVEHRSSYRTSVRGPDHVITDWPISDHMQSSKQDVTSDIIAYYVSGTRSRCCMLLGSMHWQGSRRTFINGYPLLHCSRLPVYIHELDR